MTDPSNRSGKEAGNSPWERANDHALLDLFQSSIGEWPKRSTDPFDYVVNHWRGDLSLAKSYWLNTFLLSLPVTIMLTSLESLAQAVRATEQTALFFWLFASLTVLVFPLTVWPLVGTWRSATKRTLNTGKSGWSSVAKVLMVIGWLQFSAAVVQVADNWPAYRELASYTLGLDPMGHYTVTATGGGRGVVIRGTIARGLEEELRSVLAEMDEPSSVTLDSNGGRIGVGYSLNRLIQEQGLTTLVEDKCYSACALAFLGGQSRIVSDGALIGFHQARSAFAHGATGRTIELSANALQRLVMQEAGVRKWFTDQAMDTPTEQIWTPPVEALAEGGVITHTWTNGELRLAR